MTDDAVDRFEMYVLGLFVDLEDENPNCVTIPRDLCEAILELAKKSQHKGKGRGGVPRSELTKWSQEIVVDDAKERRAELLATGMSPKAATDAAAAEAATRLHDMCGANLAPNTIKRRMESV